MALSVHGVDSCASHRLSSCVPASYHLAEFGDIIVNGNTESDITITL